MLNAPKNAPANEYFLLGCELAELGHLTGGNPVVIDGKTFNLLRVPGGFKLTNGKSSEFWRISPPQFDPDYKAAKSLAEFFNGSIVTEEVV